MSMPAIFFVSDRATAEQVHLNHSLTPENVAERASVDTLKLSTLWTIIAGRNDDPVALINSFTEIRSSDEEWTNEVPEELVTRLATATDSDLQSAASRWIETDEMVGWAVPDAMDLLIDVRRVACRSQQTRQPMFIYVSL